MATVTCPAALAETQPLDIPLAGRPVWLVGAPQGAGSLWAVVEEMGHVQAFQVEDGSMEEVSIQPARLEPGSPPLLVLSGNRPVLANATGSLASPLTHPVLIPASGSQVLVGLNGDLVG